jgi:hypothetical protein
MPTPQERDAALARLGRGEVVALRDQLNALDYAAICDKAKERMDRILNILSPLPFVTQASELDEAFDKMITCLQEARLTISMKSFRWFYEKNTYKSYTNFFERGYSGASNDMIRRNNAEMEFGRYGNMPVSANAGITAAQSRVATYGVQTSASFQGAMRPRYAAVDFAGCQHGGAPKYGKSYLVLKEHLKHNSTYVHRDSFEVDMDMIQRKAEYDGTVPSLSDVTATFHTLAKILLYCEPAMLKKIYDYATGAKVKGSELSILAGVVYLEAHVHADILFERDVAAVCISRAELTSIGNDIHPLFNKKWPFRKTNWDQDDGKKVEKNAKQFAKDNKIQLQMVA